MHSNGDGRVHQSIVCAFVGLFAAAMGIVEDARLLSSALLDGLLEEEVCSMCCTSAGKGGREHAFSIVSADTLLQNEVEVSNGESSISGVFCSLFWHGF